MIVSCYEVISLNKEILNTFYPMLPLKNNPIHPTNEHELWCCSSAAAPACSHMQASLRPCVCDADMVAMQEPLSADCARLEHTRVRQVCV